MKANLWFRVGNQGVTPKGRGVISGVRSKSKMYHVIGRGYDEWFPQIEISFPELGKGKIRQKPKNDFSQVLCDKEKYATKKEADQAVFGMRNERKEFRRNLRNATTYLCDACNFWHMTSGKKRR